LRILCTVEELFPFAGDKFPQLKMPWPYRTTEKFLELGIIPPQQPAETVYKTRAFSEEFFSRSGELTQNYDVWVLWFNVAEVSAVCAERRG